MDKQLGKEAARAWGLTLLSSFPPLQAAKHREATKGSQTQERALVKDGMERQRQRMEGWSGSEKRKEGNVQAENGEDTMVHSVRLSAFRNPNRTIL